MGCSLLYKRVLFNIKRVSYCILYQYSLFVLRNWTGMEANEDQQQQIIPLQSIQQVKLLMHGSKNNSASSMAGSYCLPTITCTWALPLHCNYQSSLLVVLLDDQQVNIFKDNFNTLLHMVVCLTESKGYGLKHY